MRKTIITMFVFATVLFFGATLGYSPFSSAESASDCCSIVSQAVEAVSRLKEGNTRAQVEQDFAKDGGIFSRDHTTYGFKICPTIKIRITFQLDPNSKDFSAGSPRDIVQTVSKPYLEYSNSD